MRKVSLLATIAFISCSLNLVAYGKTHTPGIKHNSNSGTWYQLEDGRIAHNTWVQEGDSKYYIGEDGFAISGGWGYIDGTWYLFNSAGKLSTNTGWLKNGNEWYYSYNDIKPYEWRQIDGSWYYFNEDGVMQTGWLNLGEDWYFLGDSGKIVGDRWVMDIATKKRYYLLEDGRVARGETKIQSKKYMFDSKSGEYLGDK